MVALIFPTSSTPGAHPGEGAGRIVNAYATKDGDTLVFLPLPGLVPFATTGEGPRGGLLVGNLLYQAVRDGLFKVNADGTAQKIGTLAGTELVTMARNNKAPNPDVVIVTDISAYTTNGTTITPYADDDVGSPVSVCFLDGYFLFLASNGVTYASGLNTTDINSLSRGSAEAKPDGALRGIVKGNQYVVLGTSSTEFWYDAGTSPFPLARAEVIDVGLFGRWAVAGFEDGWDGPWIMVAADGAVRLWTGYTATKISTRDVERDIASVEVPETLSAFVYTFGGNSVWCLTGPGFTWEYHVGSGQWYERKSYGIPVWRARTAVRAFGRWLVGDLLSDGLMEVFETARMEGDAPLVSSIEGLGPANASLHDLRLSFTSGQGRADSEETPERAPQVMIDWSLNGGASYGQKLQRSLGEQGQYRRAVRVGSLGTAREQPVCVRATISDPVPWEFRGGEIVRAQPVR